MTRRYLVAALATAALLASTGAQADIKVGVTIGMTGPGASLGIPLKNALALWPERIAGEWWRRVAERQAVRDYFQVEDDAGQRFWLFRRGDGQRPETGDMTWHLHGTFG